MKHLTISDFDTQARDEVIDLLQKNDPKFLAKAEKKAHGQMVSYLARKYDVEQIFPEVLLFDNTETYIEGHLVAYKETTEPDECLEVYSCTDTSTGNLPTDETYFEQVDPRDQLVVMYLVDILLYHAYSSRAKRVVPEIREDRYEEAISWLRRLANGKLDANLPLLTSEQEDYNSDIRFSSHPKENHRF